MGTYPTLSHTFSVEKWRCIAYFFFWTMCGLAIVMSKIFVAPFLAAGAPADTPANALGCGPFNLNDPGHGVAPGDGFLFPDQTHLSFLFGFPNICVNWDYSPSREVTAMYFPLFEYALVFYLILDIFNTRLAFQRGDIGEGFWTFSKIAFFLNTLFCIWFRMIFICVAYENVQAHTAGFLGLQIALILVAVQNTLYVIMTGQDYHVKSLVLGIPINLSAATTAKVAKTYLFLLSIIGAVKVSATIYVVGHGYGAPITMQDSPVAGMKVGQLVDSIWMVFNAVLPLIIAFVRMGNEEPLKIEVCRALDRANERAQASGTTVGKKR